MGAIICLCVVKKPWDETNEWVEIGKFPSLKNWMPSKLANIGFDCRMEGNNMQKKHKVDAIIHKLHENDATCSS